MRQRAYSEKNLDIPGFKISWESWGYEAPRNRMWYI